MKVLIIITKSDIGGAQVFVHKLAKNLIKKGCIVEIAAGEGGYLFAELEKDGIKYHKLNSLKRTVNIFSFFYFVYDFFRFLNKNRFDIIHLNSSNTLIGAAAVAYLKEKPKSVFTFHGLSFLDEKYEINKVYKFVTKLSFRLMLKFIDAAVFVSRNNYEIAKNEKIVSAGDVILNGLDKSELNFLDAREARNYFSHKYALELSDSFLIGSTGRLAYQKNYEFLINNFGRIKERIPEAKIAIIGDGPNFELYKSMIKEKGLEKDFILLGAIENSYKYIKAFDIFTLPSRYEGLSISIIEALYAGLPVLASDIGGNREVMNNDSRQLYRFDDIEDYVAKLAAIKENHDQISSFNLETKELFSLDKMVESYKNLYDKLVNRH